MKLISTSLILASLATGVQAGSPGSAGVAFSLNIIAPIVRGAAASAAEFGDPLVADPVRAQVGSPMVEISKKCPSLRYLGRDATFEITVSNRGTAAAANVVVTDTIVGGTEFVSADNGGTRDGGNIVWRLGSLGAGQSKTLTVSTRCTQIGPVRNTAKVSYCAEAVAECSMDIKGIPAVLLECVDDPDPIEVGAQLTYTITVTNQGTAVGTNIRIECTVPPEQEFVKAGGTTTATAAGGMVKFASIASLAPSAKATFTVTVKGIKEADSRFHVKLLTDQTETPVEETESTHIYQ